jgi:hypothetical protein
VTDFRFRICENEDVNDGKKDIVAFSCGVFDEKHPRVVAVTPFGSDISLTQLISEFEKAQSYEPAGGCSRGCGDELIDISSVNESQIGQLD